MKIQDIINKLNAEESVEEVSLKVMKPKEGEEPKSKRGNFLSREIHRIHYNRNAENNVIKYEWFDVLVKNIGTAEEDARYHDKVPDILKESVTTRDNLMTEAEIIAEYQEQYKDKGHEVIDVRVSQQGKYDIANLRVDDGSGSISKSFTIYNKDGATEPEMKEIKQ